MPISVYELSGNRRERAQGDIEAKNIVMQAIPYELFENVDSNTTAKDIWDEIKRQQEGYDMSDVTKLNKALGFYEDFKQEPEEPLKDTYRRFNGVLNELKRCKIIKLNDEVNMKLLKKLNVDWLPYGTIVRSTKEIDKMTIHELVGVLMHYQPEVSKFQEGMKESSPGDPVALIAKKNSKSFTTSKSLSMKVLVEESTDSEELNLSDVDDSHLELVEPKVESKVEPMVEPREEKPAELDLFHLVDKLEKENIELQHRCKHLKQMLELCEQLPKLPKKEFQLKQAATQQIAMQAHTSQMLTKCMNTVSECAGGIDKTVRGKSL
ncbi:uncharacterized protein [Rutidosis leptorrhynchoides]|uniref:uncharacterized protein n=1 Tax=Rutidosis leptorrhynchoides TaxID=125765 RepID=UPI003A98ECA1